MWKSKITVITTQCYCILSYCKQEVAVLFRIAVRHGNDTGSLLFGVFRELCNCALVFREWSQRCATHLHYCNLDTGRVPCYSPHIHYCVESRHSITTVVFTYLSGNRSAYMFFNLMEEGHTLRVKILIRLPMQKAE